MEHLPDFLRTLSPQQRRDFDAAVRLMRRSQEDACEAALMALAAETQHGFDVLEYWCMAARDAHKERRGKTEAVLAIIAGVGVAIACVVALV